MNENAPLLLGWLGLSLLFLAKPAIAAPSPSPWADFVETNFPFFSSVVDARQCGPGLPADNLTPRGLVLNLGHETWACFDTDLLRVSVLWSGRCLSPVSMAQVSYHTSGIKAPEGQDKLPRPLGTTWLANGIFPGWQIGDSITLRDPRAWVADPKEVGRGPLPVGQGAFTAVALTEEGVRLDYEIGASRISEWMSTRLQGTNVVVQRRFRLNLSAQTLWLLVGRRPDAGPYATLSCTVDAPAEGGRAVIEQVTTAEGFMAVKVHPVSQAPTNLISFQIELAPSGVTAPTKLLQAHEDRPATLRWPTSLVTQMRISPSTQAYVMDPIPLPTSNPWRRNVRLADLAFFPDGRAAAVSFDGDVWMISGLGQDLPSVRWKRFASGLHEPLGICLRDQSIFVFDRNGIWRLQDIDDNGEADRHELFSNVFTQTAETREFANGIRAAPDGSFVIGKGGQQGSTTGKHNGMILRIGADGKSATILGQGLRQPFIGLHPHTGLITASDQQGHYVPTTALHIIDQGRYYGFLSLLLPKERYPATIADPITWIPHAINASGAGQVWLTDDRMGPLSQGLIHLGYYRPEIFAVLLHQRTPRLQAAVVSLTRDFDFAPLNGAVNPHDGQLYVTGFQVWGTSAKEISGLSRCRYTNKPSNIPRKIVAFDQGVLVRFDRKLDSVKALEPGNFSAERWNYVRTADYGSPHFRLDGSKGQETLTPSSAYLSSDGKSVFVGIRDLKPVMQMRFGWTIAADDGTPLHQSTYFTPYDLPVFDPVAEGFGSITINLTPRAALPATVAPATVEEGHRVAELMGCVACHSNDGSTLGKVGPSWKGIYGSYRTFAGGGKAKVDEAYLRESIREPTAKIVAGFDKSDTGMPSYEGVLTDDQIEALVLYIKTLH